MTNAFGKDVDTTYLDPQTAFYRQVVHRDMIAHTARWGYVCRLLNRKRQHQTFHVLDAGCGKLVNLAKAMYHGMLTHTTGSYTGVDYGKIPWPETINPDTKKFNMRLHEKTDFADWDPQDALPKGGFDLITSFEVLEHVEPLHTYRMLRRMRELIIDQKLTPKGRTNQGRAVISTPNYSEKVGAAKNHVNEMTYEALNALIHASGWEVESVFGTFASQRDYKKHLRPEQLEFMNGLQEYYDSTMVSVIMAPLLPAELSRNCMWVLKPGSVAVELLADKQLASAHHSSSSKWKSQRTKIIKMAKAI